jgi:hypothetical protein
MRFETNGGWRTRTAAVLALALAAGCTDDLPTATGESRFPGGIGPVTVEILLDRASVLLGDAVFDGFADPRNARYLLAAEDFGGALDAHTLARFPEFPEAVTYSTGGASVTDSVFEYVSGELRIIVNAGESEVPAPVTMQLWSLEQAWDSSTVTWELASEGEPWTEPGGTRGELLSEATWARGDTIVGDTVAWQLDSLAVRRLAAEGARQVLITLGDPGARVQFGALRLTVSVRPESTPDTTVTTSVATGAQNFVFTPPPPAPAGVYRVGGVTAARTVLHLDLAQLVPGCPDPGTGCAPVSLRDVTINAAELVLQPVQVTSGFEPISASTLVMRRLLEPELGRLAPLGETVFSDTVSATKFAGGEQEPVRFNLTSRVRSAVASDPMELPIALLGETAPNQFGYQWYVGEPVVRLVYTLPIIQRLP